jgi:hypothetical protein
MAHAGVSMPYRPRDVPDADGYALAYGLFRGKTRQAMSGRPTSGSKEPSGSAVRGEAEEDWGRKRYGY